MTVLLTRLATKVVGLFYIKVLHMSLPLIYRQVEQQVTIQTTTYTALLTLHAEASFPTPDPLRDWRLASVALQIPAGTVVSGFNIMFYTGVTGRPINSNPAGMPNNNATDLGAMRASGVVELLSTEQWAWTGGNVRFYAKTLAQPMPLFVSVGGIYKFQTITTAAITPLTTTAKFVFGLVSGG